MKMFNSNYTNNNKIEFHSVSGLMCKSHPKSIICQAKNNPFLLDYEKPRKYNNDYAKDNEVVVLQVMICEGGFIIEYLPKKIYEEELKEVKDDD